MTHLDSRTSETVPPDGADAAAGRKANDRVTGSRAQASESRHAAVQTWENEGGHFPALRSVALTPTDVSQLIPEGPSSNDALVAMRARFVADFADGLMGWRHNTFQHRSRALRRLAEAGRIREAGPQPE